MQIELNGFNFFLLSTYSILKSLQNQIYQLILFDRYTILYNLDIIIEIQQDYIIGEDLIEYNHLNLIKRKILLAKCPMGKKRIEKIERIQNSNQRKVCLCKRKKGLLKKAIELSVLCELEIFMFIYDRNQERVSHYASHEEF